MTAITLAFKNLLGAGLRTWLNVGVLSFTFVVIVFYNGMLDGWNRQALDDTTAWETGGGQIWHKAYDRYDPFALSDAHAPVSPALNQMVQDKKLLPVLITQGSVFPHGRMVNILIKGIDPGQEILRLPTGKLRGKDTMDIPVIMGSKMARTTKLNIGDKVIIQWRDRNGTFDAREVTVADVFRTSVPSVDQGQIWIALDKWQEMTGMQNEATLMVMAQGISATVENPWIFKSTDELHSDIAQIIQSKKAGSRLIYGLLLAIALLAIFDTQVLSVFRRQREIGTYIALGMTRSQVVRIFTLEGSFHSILALLIGAIYGIPVLLIIRMNGIPMPASTDEMGVSISDSIIPAYSLGMILSSVLLVVISATIVSYMPARRISKMNPTDALKGKIQ